MKKKFLPVFFSYILLVFAYKANAQGGTLPLNGSVNGTLTSSTADVWDVTTNSDGLLRLTFTTVSPADLYVTLYDNNGTTVVGGPIESYNNSTVTLSTDGLAAGSYHAKITPFSTAFGSYTLADSLFTPALTNDIEPNGTTATAVTLPLNGSKTGHVGYYYNNQRDTADWYKVTTTADGLLRVSLNSARGSVYSSNTLDVNVWLYDNDGTTQLGFVEVYNGGVPGTGTIITDGLAPGTYYVKVQPFSNFEFADYTLSDSLFTPVLANDLEPNGTTATAVTLPLNGSKTGHVGYYYNNQRDTADWYKVTTTADGLLRVSLTTASGSIYSSNPLDVNVWLYDNDGTTQLGFVEVNGPATNSITTDGLASGTYYVKVQPFSINEFADYTLSDSLFAPPLANDVEPNGTTATAVTLPLNGSKTGHVGYYYNNQRDTADWYKVTTTADGLLRVSLTTARGSIYSSNTLDVNLTLYDNNGTKQLGAVEVYNGGTPGTGAIITDGLASGTYYIKVQPFSTNEFADYTLSDSLFTPALANDVEPNGTTATAVTLPRNGSTGHVGYYYNSQRDTSDLYKVTTIAGGLLRLSFTTSRGSIYSSNTLDVNLTLYDNDGATQLGNVEAYNAGGPTTVVLNVDVLAAGTYYIKLQPFSSNEFADYTLSDSLSVALPVTFINFDGTLHNNQALLNWSTAAELNNKGFEVEKSADGQTFTGIGFVRGNGNSSLVNNYNYTDIKVLSGYNYYRLKQVDIDGNFNYSSTIRLDFKNFDWAIFGNPVTSCSWMQLQLDRKANVAIQIISIDGKVIQAINKGNIPEGTYSIPLTLGNAPSGTYIVKLILDNQSFSKTIIK
jgi:hypothetical protein